MRSLRLRQGSLQRPSPAKPKADGVRAQPFLFRRVAQRNPSAAPHDHCGRALVSGLFFGSCPTNVIGPIATLIVLPIQSMRRRRLRANVGQEVLEAASADVSGINVNPAPAPKIPALVTRIRGPSDHGRPALVFAGNSPVGFMTVCRDGFSHADGAETPARPRSRKLRRAGDGFAAAVANAPPHSDRATVGVPPVWSALDNSQSADTAPDEVHRCCHA